MFNLFNVKLTKRLGMVVFATMLFGSVAMAGGNACETSECKTAQPEVKAAYIKNSLRNATGVADRSAVSDDLVKILKLLQSNTAGFFEPLAQNLAGVFDTIIGVIKTVSSGGTIQFDYSSIGPRIEVLVAVASNIAIAAQKPPTEDNTTSLYYKEEHVLIKYGMGITGVILDMINPYTTSGTLAGDKAKLARLLREAQAGPNMGPDSVANTNVKEEMETLLRDCRNLALARLVYVKGFKETSIFKNFSKAINKGTVLRLDSVLRWKELKVAMSDLRSAQETVNTYIRDEVGHDKINSAVYDREKLAVKLRSARLLKFTDDNVTGKSLKIRWNLEKEIARITGIRLNPAAKLSEIDKATKDLEKAVKYAKGIGGDENVLASKKSKDALLRELHIARFLKFRLLAKKGWKVNNELDMVILKLNWTSVNINATQKEVDDALAKIKDAVKKATEAPNKW